MRELSNFSMRVAFISRIIFYSDAISPRRDFSLEIVFIQSNLFIYT